MKTTNYPRVSETRTVATDTGTFLVHKYSIAATYAVVYCVYEQYAGHSSTTSFDDVSYGSLTARPLPANIDAINPRTDLDRRLTACDKWRDDLRALAYGTIVTAFPEAAHGARRYGNIEIDVRDLHTALA